MLDKPFLPNVIKFYPFPDLVPALDPISMDSATQWNPTKEFEALASIPESKSEGALLYIHIPYCDFFCPYCPLYKTTQQKDYVYEQQSRYVNALCKELVSCARLVAPGRVLTGIYIGGGTPTSLPLLLMQKILNSIRNEFQFAEDLDFSIEGIPPHFADLEKLDFFISNGISRISFGVQSLQEETRKMLGRGDHKDDCYAAVEAAKKVGINHINVDMMYGYPDQSVDDFLKDIQQVRELGADSVDFYYHMPIMGTPYRKMIKKGRIPSKNDSALLRSMRVELLDHMKDWNQITTECFDRTGTEPGRIWSQICGGKTGVAEIIAIGVSSYGQIAGYYYYNKPTLKEYLKDIENSGLLPLRGRIRLCGKTLALRMLFGSIIIGCIPKRFLNYFDRPLKQKVRNWCGEGLLVEELDSYRLSQRGQVCFQMLICECVPLLSAFVMTRNYMMTFDEQRVLLFKHTDLLYARSISQMIAGTIPFLSFLRGFSYQIMLKLPDRMLDYLVNLVSRFIRWRFKCVSS